MATFFWATTGNDSNSGTIGSPKLTMRAAVGLAFAGDTVYGRGGTYTGVGNSLISASTTVRGGTSWSNAITIAPYQSEPVTIADTGTPNLIALTSATQQYIILGAFRLDASLLGSESGGIYLGPNSHHIRVQDAEVFGADGAGGIVTAETNAGDNEFLRLIVHDNGETNTPFGHGYYIQSPRNLIEGGTSYDNFGWGVQIYAGNTDGNIVRKMWVRDNARGSGGGIVAAGGPTSSIGGVKIYYNLISGTHPDGYGLQIGTDGGSTALNFEAYRNTIMAADAMIIKSSSNGALVKGNILRTLNNAGAGTIVDEGTGSSITPNFTSNPTFTNGGGSYVLLGDFALGIGSGAIDTGPTLAGITEDFHGVSVPQGAGPDYGAFEAAVSGSGSTSGVAATSAVGSLVPSNAHGLAGNSATSAIGTLTVSGGVDPTSTRQIHVCSSLISYLGGTSAFLVGNAGGSSQTIGQPLAIPVTFRNWYLTLTAAPGAGTSYTYVLHKNDVATALTITIADAATSGSSSADVHFNAGDTIKLVVSNVGAPAAHIARSAIEMVPDTTGLYLYGYSTSANAGVPRLAPFGSRGNSWKFDTDFHRANVMGVAGTITTLMHREKVAPGVGTSRIFTLYKNGVAQDGTAGTPDTRVTIADANTVASASFSLAVIAGDSIELNQATSGAPAASTWQCGTLAFQPTTATQYQFCTTLAGAIADGTVEYGRPGDAGLDSWFATEANVRCIGHGSVDLTFETIRADISAAAGTGKSWTWTLRKNGADSALALTISGAVDTTGAATTSPAITITSGDTWDLAVVGTSVPSGTIHRVAIGYGAPAAIPLSEAALTGVAATGSVGTINSVGMTGGGAAWAHLNPVTFYGAH